MAGKDNNADKKPGGDPSNSSDFKLVQELQARQAEEWEQATRDLGIGDNPLAPSMPSPKRRKKQRQTLISSLQLRRYFLYLQEKGIRSVSEDEWRDMISDIQKESLGPSTLVALVAFGSLRLARWGVRQRKLLAWNRQQQQKQNQRPLKQIKSKSTSNVVSFKELHAQKKEIIVLPKRKSAIPLPLTKKEECPDLTLFMETTRLRRVAWGILEALLTVKAFAAFQTSFVLKKQLEMTANNALIGGGASLSTDVMCDELRPMTYLLLYRDLIKETPVTSEFFHMSQVVQVVRNCERRRAYQRDLLKSNGKEADHNHLKGLAIPVPRVPEDYPYPQPSSIDDNTIDPEAKQRADILQQCDPYLLVLPPCPPPPSVSSESSSSNNANRLEELKMDNLDGRKPLDDDNLSIEELLKSMDTLSVSTAQKLVEDHQENSDAGSKTATSSSFRRPRDN